MGNDPSLEIAESKTAVAPKNLSQVFLKIVKHDMAFNAVNVFFALVLWTIVGMIVNSPFVPVPAKVWKATLTLIQFGDIEGFTLSKHITASIIRILAGFGLACLLGVPLGILMGLFPRLYTRTRAVIEPIRFIPPIAWIPMSIVILVGFSRYVFLIWLGAFFPIWINTLVGVGRVNQVYMNVAKVFGGDKKTRITKIVVPSVLPDITSGMRVGLGMAWMCIVAAEMIGGEAVGVGRLILKYAELLQLAPVISGMLIIGIIGFLMNEILLKVEKRMFRWRWEVSL
jgi:ABC-type nitrate/sulfonate/bicarbonate transport system permease component